MARQRNRVLDFLAYLPQGAFLALARALPWRARLALGAAVLRAGVALLPDFRRRIDSNLRLIFPDMPADERRRVAREVGDNFGRTFVETFSARDFQARAPWSQPAGPGWEALRPPAPRAGARCSSAATSASGKRSAARSRRAASRSAPSTGR